MTVRKSGNRFFPVKKNGTLWKTGFSSKAKAEAAIRQNKARLSKLSGRSGGGGSKPRKSSSGNPSPASKSHSKGMTHGKFMKGLALGGPAVNRLLLFAEGAGEKQITAGIPQDYAGIDPRDGSFELERLARGYGGGVYAKIESFIFNGAGVQAPSLKRKGMKSKIKLGVYHGAAVTNASGGSSNSDKFRRFYHSHYGVDLTKDGFDALDYSKPIIEKVVPYIIVSKLMNFIK